MKRRTKGLALSVAGLSALVVLMIGASPANADSYSAILYAGQSIPAGVVNVETTQTTVSVSFDMYDGYCLTQAHVDLAGSDDPFPLTKQGNPKIGNFQYNEKFSTCQDSAGPYEFTELAADEDYQVAAHAVVWDKASLTKVNIFSRPGVPFNGGLAVAATEPGVGVTYPNCPAADNDAVKSIWDNNAKYSNGVLPNWGGADWIWATDYPVDPVLGEYFTFTDTFTVDAGWQVGPATLILTADNAYSAVLNGGTAMNSISLGPQPFSTLMALTGTGVQQGDWGVASQGWQLVNRYNVNLVPGENTLAITAFDEYMWDGTLHPTLGQLPKDQYLNWNYGTQSYTTQVVNDPKGSDRCINPRA